MANGRRVRRYERDVVVVARATDGRDFVKGIAGGWSDKTTVRRARERGIEWSRVVERVTVTPRCTNWDNSSPVVAPVGTSATSMCRRVEDLT